MRKGILNLMKIFMSFKCVLCSQKNLSIYETSNIRRKADNRIGSLTLDCQTIDDICMLKLPNVSIICKQQKMNNFDLFVKLLFRDCDDGC